MKHGLVQKQKVSYQKSSAAPQFRRSDLFVLKKASYQKTTRMQHESLSTNVRLMILGIFGKLRDIKKILKYLEI